MTFVVVELQKQEGLAFVCLPLVLTHESRLLITHNATIHIRVRCICTQNTLNKVDVVDASDRVLCQFFALASFVLTYVLRESMPFNNASFDFEVIAHV